MRFEAAPSSAPMKVLMSLGPEVQAARPAVRTLERNDPQDSAEPAGVPARAFVIEEMATVEGTELAAVNAVLAGIDQAPACTAIAVSVPEYPVEPMTPPTWIW